MTKASQILYGEYSRQAQAASSQVDASDVSQFFQARVRAWPGSKLEFDESADGQPLVFLDLAFCEGEQMKAIEELGFSIEDKIKTALPLEGLGDEKFYMAAVAFSGWQVSSIEGMALDMNVSTEWLRKGLEEHSIMVKVEDHPCLGLWADGFILNSAEPL